MIAIHDVLQCWLASNTVCICALQVDTPRAKIGKIWGGFRFGVRKALVQSQLPADTSFPKNISLQLAGVEDQWDMRLQHHKVAGFYVEHSISKFPSFAAYVGRSICSMGMGEDGVLTLTLRALPAAAAAGAAPGLPAAGRPTAQRPASMVARGSVPEVSRASVKSSCVLW